MINYTSAGNLISFTIDKNYKISSLNIDSSLLKTKELLEEMMTSSINEAYEKVKNLNSNNNQSSDKFNSFNFGDIKDMMGDITKLTNIKFEDGKPVLTFDLNNVSPDVLSKFYEMMNNDKDKDDN